MWKDLISESQGNWRFDEEYSRFLDKRKQAKMKWLQDPNQNNVDKTNDVRHQASRHFGNKKKRNI